MKDIIRYSLTIEADFETIQTIRQALAHPKAVERISADLQGALEKYLRAITDASLDLSSELAVSEYRKTKEGPRAPLPQVVEGVLSWYDVHEEKHNVVGKVGSRAWVDWLDDPLNRSFSYVSRHEATFTGLKRKDGVWYAHKRLDGKLKRKYLGKGEKVTIKKMERVAFELAQREFL